MEHMTFKPMRRSWKLLKNGYEDAHHRTIIAHSRKGQTEIIDKYHTWSDANSTSSLTALA